MKNIINTRSDLDALQGTQAHADFMAYLKGSMTRRENQAVYPDNYNDPDYDGPAVEPVWVDVEALSLIARFGFTKEDFEDV
jgi:hypothetical protein